MLTLAGFDINGELIAIVAVSGGLLIAILAVTLGILQKILNTRARETTKREVAAYVAEGSISPDDAERIIKADLPRWEK